MQTATEETRTGGKNPLRLLRRRKEAAPGGAPRRPGRKPWTKKRIILLSALSAAVIAGGVGVYALFFTEEEQIAVTGETTYGYLNEALEGSGTTTPADSVTYTVSGTVLEWHVETCSMSWTPRRPRTRSWSTSWS